MVSFQCSPLSTPDGIVGTFKQCARLQKDKNLDEFVSVVVLDEVGLAEDSPRMPLKVAFLDLIYIYFSSIYLLIDILFQLTLSMRIKTKQTYCQNPQCKRTWNLLIIVSDSSSIAGRWLWRRWGTWAVQERCFRRNLKLGVRSSKDEPRDHGTERNPRWRGTD